MYFGKNFKLLKYLISFLILISIKCYSQNDTTSFYSKTIANVKDDILISGFIHYGKIWKHTSNFKPTINGPSSTFEIDIERQSKGNQTWIDKYNSPQYGLSASVIRFNNDSILGYAYGIMPYLLFPIITKNDFQLSIRAGSGIAWLTKHYDVIKNSDNNVIASSINNITSIGLRARYKISKNSSLNLGTSFSHYSTGDARLPNLGINVPALNLGYTYLIKSYSEETIKRGYFISKTPKKLIFRNKFTLARFEALQANGPIYSQYGTEFGIGKYLSTTNKLFINADLFYNSFSYYFLINQDLDKGKQIQRSLGSTIAIEDEIMVGKLGINFALGFVLYQPHFSGASNYQKVGLQYHFINWGEKKPRNLFLGVHLKTHWANAEHVETCLGFEW